MFSVQVFVWITGLKMHRIRGLGKAERNGGSHPLRVLENPPQSLSNHIFVECSWRPSRLN